MKPVLIILFVILSVMILLAILDFVLKEQLKNEKQKLRHEQQIQEIKDAIMNGEIERSHMLADKIQLTDEDVQQLNALKSRIVSNELDELKRQVDYMLLPDCTPAQNVLIKELEQRAKSSPIDESIAYLNTRNQILSSCR